MDLKVKQLFTSIRRGNRGKIKKIIESDIDVISKFCDVVCSSPGYIAAIKYKKVDSLLELLSCNVIDKLEINFILKCAISAAISAYNSHKIKSYKDNLDTTREIVKILIDNGATPQCFDMAISYKDRWMAKFLVDKGVDYEAEGVLYKPMNCIVHSIIKFALKDYYNPNIVILGKTILQHAIEYNDSSLVVNLVKEGADVNLINNKTHESNVELAARKGNSEILRILVNAGVDINSYTYYPAIYHAVSKGYIVMTRLLLKKGAKLFVDENGESLIRYAVALNDHNYTITKLLFKYGAKLSGKHENYIKNICDTCNDLYRNVNTRNTRLIMLLLKNGLDINDNISLYYLSKYNSIRVFKQLTKNIQDINNLERGYILDPMVENNKRIKFTKYLISIGAVIEPETFYEYDRDRYIHENTTETVYNTLNLLFKAVYHSSYKKVKILLENGANINAPCNKYGTMMCRLYLNNYNSVRARYNINETKKVIRILIPYLLWSGIRDNNVRNTSEYSKNIELANIMTYMKEIKHICDIELKRMKGIIISESRKITLYDFLSYRKDSDLLMLINSSNVISKCNDKLSFFKRIIKIRKLELMDKYRIINKIIEFIDTNVDNSNRLFILPSEIKFKILSYLTYKDLKYIISNM